MSFQEQRDGREGLRLLVLDTVEPSPNSRLASAVADGFADILGPGRVHVVQYAEACLLFRKARCNAVLLLNGRAMRVAIVRELLRLSPRNVLWTTEDPCELPANVRRAAAFDHVFSNDPGSLADYAGKAHHLPPAAEAGDGPLPLERRYCDVFFAGIAWPGRVKCLRDIIPRLDGLKTQFLLPGDAHLRKPRLPLPECEWNVRLGSADRLTAARHSKIVLYLEGDDRGPRARGRSLPAAKRLFETAALGVAQVAIADEATIAPYFEPGKEIVLARSAEEAARVIRELLADPARLETLGQAARARVLAEHLYVHRARVILGRMAEVPPPCRERPPCHSKGSVTPAWKIITPTRSASEGSSLALRVGIDQLCYGRNRNATEGVRYSMAKIPPRRPNKAKQQPLRLLFVAHGVRGQRPWGGTELHVDQLCRALGHKYDIHLLYTSPHRAGRSMVYRHPGTGRQRVLYAGPYNAFRSWTDPQRDAAFRKLLVEEEIHLVHFVHFLFHSFGYVEAARSLGRPSVLGLYDFFLACPQYNLLDYSGRFCNLPAIETCDHCLARMDELPAGAQGRRRELLSHVCCAVDRIHFLSHSQRALIERVLPISQEKAFVQGLGICPHVSPPPPPPPMPPLRIAVLANHARNKGADTLLGIVEQLASPAVHFRIAGAIEKEYRDRFQRLSRNSVELLGPYEPEQVGGILRGCHVALFASPWPETFMLALSEALQAGLVPVGPDLGAYGERVRDGENGLVVSGNVAAYVRTLRSLLDDPALLGRLQAGVRASRVPTLAEDAAGFERLYDGLAAEYNLPGASFPVAMEGDGTAATVAEQNPAAKSALQKAMRIYKTQGARVLFRRAWQRTSAWIRS
jgi:glycosyltransferase involved in cell wall biosynthesis